MSQNLDHIAVNDMLGRPPGWLLHSGITLVLLIVAGALIISSFIYYPDELSGQAMIQYEQAPITITPITTATLDTLFYTNGDTVKKAQLLGVLQSDADWREVLALDELLGKLTKGERPQQMSHFHKIGMLQPIYANWLATASAIELFEKNNGISHQRKTIAREITYIKELIYIAERQLALFDEQIDLKTRDYNRQSLLAEQGVISSQSFENQKMAWLAIQQQRKNLEANLVEYQLKINQLQQQSDNLQREGKDEAFARQQDYIQATEELKGQIQSWKERYLLLAPLSGHLVFVTDIIEKQIVEAGQPLFFIQPELVEKAALVAKISIPAQGLGKITVGDKVVLRLDAYPEKEFGTISTQLRHIAALPQTDNDGRDFYRLEAPLEEPLKTTYGKVLNMEIQMSGIGTIITKNRSILDRVFEQLLNLIKQD